MQPTDHKPRSHRLDVWIYLGFVLLTAFFTYVYRYWEPPAVFWDEPYHIAAAQKYMNGVFFMEQHPPLGKLLIAAGEKITHANAENNQFIGTDYARDFPADFSFVGYRLFPVLLAWLTAAIFYFIFLFFTGEASIAALLSFLYIFDNAEIVHSRGAMVDSPLTFFGALAILLFLLLQRKKKPPEITMLAVLAFAFGAAFGLAVTTKVVGAIFVLLIPAALVRLFPNWQRIGVYLVASFCGFIIAFTSVWYIHFSLGNTYVESLDTQGKYHSSEEYQAIVTSRKNKSLASFPLMLKESLAFVGYYNEKVPRLDLCKPDENGSPAYLWPIGARTINYRWENAGENTNKYLYLVSNPVSWALGLLGVILAAAFILSSVLRPGGEKLHYGYEMAILLGMYLSYMLAISTLGRVMYLYHYFLPLTFSFMLFGVVFMNIRKVWHFDITESVRTIIMTALAICMFGAFLYYRPLSYYEPITNDAVTNRAILPLWELTCVQCEKVSPIVVPVKRDN